MLGRISIDCFALATMYGQVRLPVAIEIKHAQHKRPIERLFKDTSRDGLAVPLDDAGQGNVKRYELHWDDASVPWWTKATGFSLSLWLQIQPCDLAFLVQYHHEKQISV